MGWVLAILVVGGCIGLIWLAQRIEPHWVSKDGQRFTCRVAELRPQRGEVGQWSEARVASTGDALTVAVKPKLFRRHVAPRPVQILRVQGRAESDRNGLIVYMLAGDPPMALRVPWRSRAVKTLDALAADPPPPAPSHG